MLTKNDEIGDYTLIRFLGKGQFGEVWLADKQTQFSTRKLRHVLKFLLNQDIETDLQVAEAEIDAWIEVSRHQNLLYVMDMFTYEGHIVIVSEFADGGSLRDWFRENKEKATSIEKAIEMMLGVLRGIEHLHFYNIVHGNLTPNNILLQGDIPQITDFGISRITSGNEPMRAFEIPQYQSLEAIKGNISVQTDIWSAGVILYEMLSGSFPFSHQTFYGLFNSLQHDEQKSLPVNVPVALREIVNKALKKDSALRFQTIKEMREALEAV